MDANRAELDAFDPDIAHAIAGEEASPNSMALR